MFNLYIPMKSHKTASNTLKSQDFPPDLSGFQRRRATDGIPLWKVAEVYGRYNEPN